METMVTERMDEVNEKMDNMKEMMEKLMLASEKKEETEEAGEKKGSDAPDADEKKEPDATEEKKEEPDATEDKKEEPDSTEDKKEEPVATEEISTSQQELPKDKVSELKSDDSRVDLFETMQIDHKTDQIQHQISEVLQNSMTEHLAARVNKTIDEKK